ncbi:MAG: sigma-70 family RNA polymerase sigma factor [Methylococcaceae bacterium]|nr:sigma-70 family RNA polymerase sigma factor [Methylococcaceae bacterium]
MSEQSPEFELERLLAAICQGDETAMAAFYDRTCGKVFALVSFILEDVSQAEEVALDTFFQVWQEAGKYQAERASPLAWLMMMARSRAIDRLRSMRRAPNFFDSDDLADELIDPGEGPDEVLLSSERSRRVRACLAQLPQVERQKLTLAFFKGLSQAEMSQYCDMPLGTVKSHIRSGMARLSRLLGEQADMNSHEKP